MIPASKSSWMIYFYPRPPRGGRQGNFRDLTDILTISIHALREEGDTKAWTISPGTRKFLSTPSARRATTARRSNKPDHNNFYPRPPRGGRPRYPGVMRKFHYFYPRPPRGGRHPYHCSDMPLSEISIHALREEGDHGLVDAWAPLPLISIHALREEGDVGPGTPHTPLGYFYPRPPRGGRPRSSRNTPTSRPISIHALREEGDSYTSASHWRDIDISIHALREEGDRAGAQRRRPYSNFYPRPPRGGRRGGRQRPSS